MQNMNAHDIQKALLSLAQQAQVLAQMMRVAENQSTPQQLMERCLMVLVKGGPGTLQDVIFRTKMDPKKASNSLTRLHKEGRIANIGSARRAIWCPTKV